jgi:hypothetical protein
MSIPPNVMRCSILGVGPGSEQFDVSFWMQAAAAPATATDANTLATAIRDLWVANAKASWIPLIATDQRYSEIRVYSYPSGGPSATAIGTASIATADGTGAGAASNALQVCMVLSLLSDYAGRRFRGRMYLPATGQSVGSGHVWPSSVMTSIHTGTAAFFTAVNARSTTQKVSIVSQVGAGNTALVRTVRVDNKPDIQRRRANKLASTIVNSAPVT